MDNRKDDKYYAAKALKEIEAIEKYFQQKSYQELIGDGLLLDAVMFRLVQMVEHVKNLSVEFKMGHPEIPWRKITGFRNTIVHEYGRTDYSVVFEVITKNLSSLKEVLSFAE